MGTELIHRLRHLHVTARLGRSVTYINGQTAVQVLLDIRPATKNPNAPPLDLRFVIDTSGSMRGEKIDAVKTALHAVINDLEPTDRLTIITFADFHRIDLSATQMNDRGKVKARSVIDGIDADGGTFISGGLEEAITRPDLRFETRIVLFTDGESTVRKDDDHAQLARCADYARRFGLPVLTYGTGPDYNFALLQQIAAQADNGSFLKHVLTADVLRDHLLAEIGFLRGVGVRKLVVMGACPKGTKITRVTRFMPMQQDIDLDTLGFKDASGALDIARGQQYLIELIVDNPQPGSHDLITLTLEGKTAGQVEQPFLEQLTLQTTFTHNPGEQTVVDPEVMRVLLMMVAAQKAKDRDFTGAANLYTRAGDGATADLMRDMAQRVKYGRVTATEAHHTVDSVGGGSVSVRFTEDVRPKRRDP